MARCPTHRAGAATDAALVRLQYGRFSGVAFHYVSSLSIALVSHFIPCDAWEGI
jgi:hypothetical protein